jgi:hypothetical protein
MFLHELSRRLSQRWIIKVDSKRYGELVRQEFDNRCPYCLRTLAAAESVIEHLDGMNRYRAGLHVSGNVLVACRRCNCEKRRDDSLKTLMLADSGWASFLSHDGARCASSCLTCQYWKRVWEDETERSTRLAENERRIRSFRCTFPEFVEVLPALKETLPQLLTKLYSDCQNFAEMEIKTLLERFDEISRQRTQGDSGAL